VTLDSSGAKTLGYLRQKHFFFLVFTEMIIVGSDGLRSPFWPLKFLLKLYSLNLPFVSGPKEFEKFDQKTALYQFQFID